jgi:hypothetical protein
VFVISIYSATLSRRACCLNCAISYSLTLAHVCHLYLQCNTIAPRVLSQFCNAAGADYLRSVVGGFTTRLLTSDDELEIDPRKLAIDDAGGSGSGSDALKMTLETNAAALSAWCDNLLTSIEDSVADLPFELKYAMHTLRTTVDDHYAARAAAATAAAAADDDKNNDGNNSDASASAAAAAALSAANRERLTAVHNSLASFFFLRFVCPVSSERDHFTMLIVPTLCTQVPSPHLMQDATTAHDRY